MIFRCSLLMVAVAVAIAGCGDDSGAAAATDATTAPPSTSTTVPRTNAITDDVTLDDAAFDDVTLDTAAVPDEITLEYVQAVIDELYGLEAEAVRLWWETDDRVPTAQVIERLVAAFGTEFGQGRIDELARLGIQDDLDRFADPPGAVEVTLEELGTVRRDCVSAIGTANFDARVGRSLSGQAFYAIRPDEPGRLKRSAWVTNGGDLAEDGSLPEEDPCG